MNRPVVVIATTLLIFGITLVGAFAADEPKGPIKVTNFGKKPIVTFKHVTHKKNLKCKTCHHNEKDGNFKCGTPKCHQAKKAEAPKIKDAVHKKKTGKCWSCHFKKSPKVTHPMKCKDCHIKK